MSNLSKIVVVLLAGGFGTRLQTKTNGKPKVLVEVKKHPFLEYLLNQLNIANFNKVVLCTGYLSDQIEKTFGKKYRKLDITYSPEKQPLGTGGSLKNAIQFLNSDTILVMNGDSFCDIDFKKFYKFHLTKKAMISMVLLPILESKRFGKVEINSDGEIIGFQEKEKEGVGLINAGIYLINKELIGKILKGKISLERDLFTKWIGKDFYGYKVKGNFIDIGIPEDYDQSEQFFAKVKL